MAQTTVDVLCEAWALIEDPKHWCQGHFALDSKGNIVAPGSQAARRYCSIGATDAIQPRRGRRGWLRRAAMMLYAELPSTVNDTLGHSAVERMYALAVAIEVEDQP